MKKGEPWVCLKGQPAPTDIHMSRLGNCATIGSWDEKTGMIDEANYYGHFVSTDSLLKELGTIESEHDCIELRQIVFSAICKVMRSNDVAP
jgi:hypothetical protein